MVAARESQTDKETLTVVFDRLKKHPSVDGILLYGSGAHDPTSPHGDYDIACVLNDAPQEIMGITTFIQGKFAEIFFYTPEEVNQALAAEAVDLNVKVGWIANWSRDGQIIFDRSGLLARLKESSNERKDVVPEPLAYQSWFRMNYNLVQNRRYLNTGEAIYLEALDIKFLYCILECFIGYFNVRSIAWRGEKEAIKWLQEHDADFYHQFQDAVRETSREKKFALYENLVHRALKPTRGVWDGPVTSVIPIGVTGAVAAGAGLRYWERLLGNA